MKVFYDIAQFNPSKPVVLTPGTFDGVHFGHKKILSRLTDVAQKQDMESVVLTFSPHPRKVLFPDDDSLRLINTLDEKVEQLGKLGIDNIIVYPFTKKFSRITALEYVRDFLVNELKVSKLIIGYDHQFGKNREGDFEYLKELSVLYDFSVEEIPAQDIDDIKISSTKIRRAITNGSIDLANLYLGYEFPLVGKVVEGRKLGNTIGFPTANIEVLDENKIIPSEGAYAVRVSYNGSQYGGMLNIGKNPTVSNSEKLSIEVNLFDFHQEIYGEEVKISFIRKLRDEMKFNSIEELKEQLEQDRLLALQYV